MMSDDKAKPGPPTGRIGYVFQDSVDCGFEMYRTREQAELEARGQDVFEVDASQFVSWIPMDGTSFHPGTEEYARLRIVALSR
jgi:hypothetical protein